jgi:hypothetical protein
MISVEEVLDYMGIILTLLIIGVLMVTVPIWALPYILYRAFWR